MYDGAKESVWSPEPTLARQLHESLRALRMPFGTQYSLKFNKCCSQNGIIF